MVRRYAHWGGLAALGTVVAWSPVLGQTADVAPAGDVRHLTISPEVETTYDTNVARSDAAFAQLKRLTREDVYVQPTVTIDALMPVNREAVFLTGLVGYDYYARNTVLNRQRIDLTGGVSARLARCLPQIKGSFAQHQAHLEELLPGPGAPIATPQNTTTQASVGFEMTCPRSQGLSPNISVTHSTYENSSKFYKPTNNDSNSVMAGLSYARPGLGAIQLYGNYTAVSYDAPFLVPFPPFELKNNFNLYSGGLRYDRPIGSRLSGTVSIAYSALRPELAFNPGFTGVTYSAEVNYKVTPRANVHGLVSRATQPSNQVGAAYVIDNTRQIDASYNMGPRLILTVGGFQDPRSYQGGLGHGTSGFLTSERIDRVFGSVRYELNRRISVVLDAANEHRSSNVALFNYTSNRVGLTLKSLF